LFPPLSPISHQRRPATSPAAGLLPALVLPGGPLASAFLLLCSVQAQGGEGASGGGQSDGAGAPPPRSLRTPPPRSASALTAAPRLRTRRRSLPPAPLAVARQQLASTKYEKIKKFRV